MELQSPPYPLASCPRRKQGQVKTTDPPLQRCHSSEPHRSAACVRGWISWIGLLRREEHAVPVRVDPVVAGEAVGNVQVYSVEYVCQCNGRGSACSRLSGGFSTKIAFGTNCSRVRSVREKTVQEMNKKKGVGRTWTPKEMPRDMRLGPCCMVPCICREHGGDEDKRYLAEDRNGDS